MSKSSFLNNKFFRKSDIALICILGMMAGFLISRAALSISMILFGANALRDIPPRRWLREKWWLIGLGWVAFYAITWFWSNDKDNWHTRLEVKLPFLILPLAFAFLPRFSPRQLRIFTVSVAGMLFAAACYSTSFLIRDPVYYINGYRQSHILPTLPKFDHIRASMAIALFIVWCVYVWPFLSHGIKWVTSSVAVVLAIFLHILAAKSGLLSLYIFLAAWGVYLSFAKRKLIGIILIVAIPVCIVAAQSFLPTFRERANYIGFSLFMMEHGDKTGIGDASRLISYKLAMGLIKQHPLTGVGTGDMKTEMDKQYAINYPQVPDYGKLLPHNQFLIVALGCGIPAMVIFIVWVFMPLGLLKKNRESFFFFIVWLLLFIQLMIEPVLEVQFGVFLYLFFILIQKSELKEP